MAYIFLDESGDLGFNFKKKKTSKFFVITFLLVKNKSPIEKIIKKTFRGFTPKERKFHRGVLHAFRETLKTRIKVLSALSEKDVSVITIYLDKKRVYTKLQEEKHVLYNYVANILLDRIYTKKLIPLNEIHLIASQRETNKFLNHNFKQYLKDKVLIKHKLPIKIEIKSSHQEKCLQVADFVSWAIFRKYEHGDESYYDIIKTKIFEENHLFH
jgi:hypothetical protein